MWLEMQFELKTQCNQSYVAWWQKVVALPGVSKRINQAWVRKILFRSQLLSGTRHRRYIEFLVSGWSYESRTFCSPMGGVHIYLEDMRRLTMLSMFWDMNAMGVVIEGKDEVKLQYLTFGMTVSKRFGRSTYAAFWDFSMNRMAVEANVVEVFLAYWLSCFVLPSDP